MRKFLPVLFVSSVMLVPAVHAELAQEPLHLGAGNVPGNLAIVPSVEYPTVDSVANLDPSYKPSARYVGYFDAEKCYDYSGSATEAERHFTPVKSALGSRCPGPFWSGNYLNWATTQTIDPFRLALTGGLRVKDTPTETWVEKARHYGSGSFAVRTLSGAATIADATPFNADSIKTYIQGKGKYVEFELTGTGTLQGTGASATPEFDHQVYEFSNQSNSWEKYRDGKLSSVETYNGRSNVIKKSSKNDPDGGYTKLGETIGRNFVLTGWFAHKSKENGGAFVRFAVSDGNAKGYGPKIGADSIAVEKRDGGSTSQLGGAVNFNRQNKQWYWFEFVSNADNTLTLTVADDDKRTNAVSVTSTADTSYSAFSRIYIHGGYDFYLDDLSLVTYKSTDGALAWPYDGAGANRYKAAVRVAVCVPGMLEPHCKPYSRGWKPEGLLQEYSDRIRYSVFGYLNDNHELRDGGVMRARQKFIGLRARDPNAGWMDNSAAEWDAATGVLKRNPDAADAAQTVSDFGVSVSDSGAINYINKFGELNNNSFKSLDPVSELYYSATRYFRGLPQVSSYDDPYPGWGDAVARAKWVDGFPVIRQWDDPIQYSCQKNVILGIGDVNTHRDQNLPGSATTSGEPARPQAVKDDKDIDVDNLNRLVGKLEGLSLTDNNRFGATRNAGYMIGLAFDANTRDQRSDWAGKQTIQTYWVDVLENQVLQDRGRNQYWLTAKYGGFVPRCPDNNPLCELPSIEGPGDVTEMPQHWWYTNGETLTQSGVNLKRADNYYAAGQADKMVAGLRQAFADIASSMRSTSTALTFNSSRLRTDSYVFQALFDSTRWSGDLQALAVSKQGVVSSSPKWSAAAELDALSDVALRQIITADPLMAAGNGDGALSNRGKSFTWADLSSEQRAALVKDDENGGTVDATVGQGRVAWIRGDRSQEGQEMFRRRDSRLGDIVNSDPQYISTENFGYVALGRGKNAGFAASVGDAYSTFRSSESYKNRTPLVVVGANDGMLHIFNADSGEELLAYVPASAYERLYQLTKPDYAHRYYVDGTARLADAWLGNAWHTLAVGTGGAGGNSVFALDITNPKGLSSHSLLWEYSNSKMGKLVQQPAVVALPNGSFGVVVTSGYDAPQAEAYVWILDAKTGTEVAEFELPSGELGTPLVADLDRDRVADRIYVGGNDGKLWRIDLDGKVAGGWGVHNAFKSGGKPAPLFVATDDAGVPQPITAPPVAALTTDGAPVVLFGTGSFIQVNDTALAGVPQVNTFYGIFDQDSPVAGRADLTRQTILAEASNGAFSARVLSKNPVDASSRGWYLDLKWQVPTGERVVSKASVQGQQVIFSTLVPSSDPCSAGGESWVMSLSLQTGGRMPDNVFDYNQDGVVDEKDGSEVTYEDKNGQDVTEELPGSGIKEQPSSGIIKSPSVVASETGDRYVCFAGSSDTSPKCVLINGGLTLGRQSWRELIEN